MVKLKFKPSSKKELKNKISSSQNLNPFKDYILDEEIDDNEDDNEVGSVNSSSVNSSSVNSSIYESNNYLLVDKYSPKNEKELVGLSEHLFIINKWYDEFINKKTNNFLILIGPTGIGKTSLINVFCKLQKLDIFRINQINTKNKKEVLDDIIKFISNNNTIDFSEITPKVNKIIILDDFQSLGSDILSASDLIEIKNTRVINNIKLKKGNVYKLFKDINIPPIIIISYDAKGSKLSDLKKTNNVLYFNELYPSVVLPWVKIICKKENIKISDKMLITLINLCKSDKRLLLNTLHYLRFSNKKLTIKYLDNIVSACKKDEDINIYDFTKRLFDKLEPPSCDEIFSAYYTEGFILENLVFENYLDYNNDMNSISISADYLATSDTLSFIDNNINNTCGTTNISPVYSLYGPSLHSRSEIKKNKCPLRSSVISNKHYLYMCNNKVLNNIFINEMNISYLDLYSMKITLFSIINSKIFSEEQKIFLKDLYNAGLTINNIESIHKNFNFSTNKLRGFGIKLKQKLLNIN